MKRGINSLIHFFLLVIIGNSALVQNEAADYPAPILIVNNQVTPRGELRIDTTGTYWLSLASEIRNAQYFITRDGSTPTLLDGPYNGTYLQIFDGETIRVVAYDSSYTVRSLEAGPLTLKAVPRVLLKISQVGKGTFGMAEQGIPLHAYGYETPILSNNVVSVFPDPVPGWRFASWGGDVSSSEMVLSLKMDAPKQIVLNFEIIPTPLAIQKTTSGIVSVKFSARQGFTYRILKSTNLEDWIVARDIAETQGEVVSNFAIDPGLSVWYRLEQTSK